VVVVGALGGVRGALLVAGIPAVVTLGRVGWVHVPEAALLLGALAVWERDPTLDRNRLALVVLGGLALLLRPTALGWLLALAAGLGWTARRRALPVLGAWGLAAVPALVAVRSYLLAKLVARDRYLADVPDLVGQLPPVVGVVPLLVAGAGLGLGWFGGRGFRGGGPVGWVLAAWALTPLALFLAFGAGLDNFTVGLAALAVLGARSWGDRRAGTLAAGLAFLVPAGLELLPPPAPDSAFGRIAGQLGLPVHLGVKNYAVPYRGWSAADVPTLVGQVCPEGRSPVADRACALGSVQGIFRPHGEDPGRFELFLTGLGEVRLVELGALPVTAAGLDAVVTWSCPEADRSWFRRYPGRAEAAGAAIAEGGFVPIWTRQVDPACAVAWWARPEQVVDPARLPLSDRLDRVELPHGAPLPVSAPKGPAPPPPRGRVGGPGGRP